MFIRVLAQAAVLAGVLASGAAYSQEALARFGRHFPNGADAVEFIYGPSGMWRDQAALQYQWNYYERCANGAHPFNKSALIDEGAVANLTAPDSDCIVLSDTDNDGEVSDEQPQGFAFVEHSGRGIAGERSSRPFNQFWFDDNWLARYMSQAYSRPLPNGLHDPGATIRWRLIGGDNRFWRPTMNPDAVNALALNGLHAINAGNLRRALAYWRTIRNRSGAIYSSTNERFEYPGLRETYELGLWAILSERMLAFAPAFAERKEVLQHATSLRSNLLSMQETDANGVRLGWRTSVSDPVTLINTETLAISVLALGANADYVLEPASGPIVAASSTFFARPHNVLSAVAGLSTVGPMIAGPGLTLEPGTYDIDFSLRTPSTSRSTSLATLEVSDGAGVLASATVTVRETSGANQWMRKRLSVVVDNPSNRMSFAVNWHGHANLDLGSIRVIRRTQVSGSATSTPHRMTTPAPVPREQAASIPASALATSAAAAPDRATSTTARAALASLRYRNLVGGAQCETCAAPEVFKPTVWKRIHRVFQRLIP